MSKLAAATTQKLARLNSYDGAASAVIRHNSSALFLTLDLFLGREAHRQRRQSLLESVSPLENGFDDVSHMSPLCSSFPSRTPLLRLHPDFCCQIPWPGPPLGFYLIVVTEGVFITCVCVLVVPCIVCLIRFIIRLCVCIFAYCYLYSRRVCV